MRELLMASSGLYEFKKILFKMGVEVAREEWYDGHRKCLVVCRDGERYIYVFKREVFKSFGKITGLKGAGEAINVSDLQKAKENLARIVVHYNRGSVYVMSVGDVLGHGVPYVNKSDGRSQYLVPLMLLERMGEEK